MLEPALDLVPNATVGYVGLQRDEKTAVASSYYCKLPDLSGHVVLLLDPMLATGGSAAWAAEKIYAARAADVRLLSVVAAPEGVEALNASFPSLTIVAAALDRELNDRKFILPGLGDFGDRLYGT
jgi:uracil phosphoribosyltransferase